MNSMIISPDRIVNPRSGRTFLFILFLLFLRQQPRHDMNRLLKFAVMDHLLQFRSRIFADIQKLRLIQLLLCGFPTVSGCKHICIII